VAYLRWALILLAFGAARVAFAQPTAPMPRPDKLTVTVGDVLIRIDGPKMWTLSGIDYQKFPIAVQESAYGSILNIRGVGALGSAHFLDVPGKPGAVEKEHVSRVQFFIDDQPVTDITPTMNLAGTSFRMERESKIRAVDLTSSVTLRDDVLIDTVRMRTKEAVDLRLCGAMMYAWSPAMEKYLYGDDRGIQKRGEFLGDSAKAGEGNEKTSRWVAVYSPREQKGAVLYVTQSPMRAGVCLQSTDAPGVYRKVRLLSFLEQTMPAGFDGTFQTAVGFFTAAESDWETIAQRRVQQLKSLAP
jgi:hypothetical protein